MSIRPTHTTVSVAAAKAGLVHVPINFRLSRREVGDILRHCGVEIAKRDFIGTQVTL